MAEEVLVVFGGTEEVGGWFELGVVAVVVVLLFWNCKVVEVG